MNINNSHLILTFCYFLLTIESSVYLVGRMVNTCQYAGMSLNSSGEKMSFQKS